MFTSAQTNEIPDVMVSPLEPAHPLFSSAVDPVGRSPSLERLALGRLVSEIMEPASFDRKPDDVLIVEDDLIIALDFEETILGFGVKTVRTAGSVVRALDMIAERAPDFALLDVGLVREKSFAIAEHLDALRIPFVFVTGYSAEVRLPAEFADRPRLPKPCSTDALKAILQRQPVGGTKC
jgi:CheY-like chemotaxis protein